MTISPDQITALKEAAEKATPGPWWYDQYGYLRGEGGLRACGVDKGEWLTPARRDQIEADRLFHRVASPQTIIILLAERERLREALSWYEEKLREALLINNDRYPARRALLDDGGSRARAALEE